MMEYRDSSASTSKIQSLLSLLEMETETENEVQTTSNSQQEQTSSNLADQLRNEKVDRLPDTVEYIHSTSTTSLNPHLFSDSTHSPKSTTLSQYKSEDVQISLPAGVSDDKKVKDTSEMVIENKHTDMGKELPVAHYESDKRMPLQDAESVISHLSSQSNLVDLNTDADILTQSTGISNILEEKSSIISHSTAGTSSSSTSSQSNGNIINVRQQKVNNNYQEDKKKCERGMNNTINSERSLERKSLLEDNSDIIEKKESLGSTQEKKKWVWDEDFEFDLNTDLNKENSSNFRDSTIPCVNSSLNDNDPSNRNALNDTENRNGTSNKYETRMNRRRDVTTIYDIVDIRAGEGNRNKEDEMDSQTMHLYKEVSNKVNTMRTELKKKKQEVSNLKALLEHRRLKKSQDRRESIMNWRKTLKKMSKENEKELSKQKDLYDKLAFDVDNLAGKSKELEGALASTKLKRIEAIKGAEKKIMDELQRAKETWITGEKARLHKLAVSKSESIKNATAKALEPELQRLISSNRNEIRTKRHEMSKKRDLLQIELQHEQDAKVRSLESHWRESTSTVVKNAKEEGKARILDLETRLKESQKDIMMKIEGESETERERMQQEILKIQEQHREECEDVLKSLRTGFQAAVEKQDNILVSLSQQQVKEVEEVKRKVMMSEEKWKSSILHRIRDEFSEKRDNQMKEMIAEHNEDLEIVLSKLKADADKELQNLELSLKQNLEEEKPKFSFELREKQEVLSKLKHDVETYQTALDTKEKLLVKLNHEQLQALEENINNLGSEISSKEDAFMLQKQQHISKLEALNWDINREEKDGEHIIRNLEEQVTISGLKSSEIESTIDKRVDDLKARKAQEVTEVHDKIHSVLNKRRDLCRSLDSQLAALKKLNEGRTSDLEARRKLTYK